MIYKPYIMKGRSVDTMRTTFVECITRLNNQYKEYSDYLKDSLKKGFEAVYDDEDIDLKKIVETINKNPDDYEEDYKIDMKFQLFHAQHFCTHIYKIKNEDFMEFANNSFLDFNFFIYSPLSKKINLAKNNKIVKKWLELYDYDINDKELLNQLFLGGAANSEDIHLIDMILLSDEQEDVIKNFINNGTIDIKGLTSSTYKIDNDNCVKNYITKQAYKTYMEKGNIIEDIKVAKIKEAKKLQTATLADNEMKDIDIEEAIRQFGNPETTKVASKSNDDTSIKNVFKRFCESKLNEGCKVQTVKSYCNIIFHLKNAELWEISTYNFSQLSVDKYLEVLLSPEFRKKKLSKASINTNLVGLRTFVNWCKLRNLMDKNIVIKLQKTEATFKRVLTQEEVDRLIAKPSSKNLTYTEIRNWTIYNLLAKTYIRRESLLSLRIKDLDFENKELYLVHLKNDGGLSESEHYLPLQDDMLQIFKIYLSARATKFQNNPNEPLFVNLATKKAMTDSTLHDMQRKYCERRGVHPVAYCHVFRHTIATRMAQQGASETEIQHVLIHSSTAMAKQYINLSKDDNRKIREKYYNTEENSQDDKHKKIIEDKSHSNKLEDDAITKLFNRIK